MAHLLNETDLKELLSATEYKAEMERRVRFYRNSDEESIRQPVSETAKPKITLVLPGVQHSQSGPSFQAVHHLVKELDANNIKTIVAVECPEEMTLEQRMKILSAQIQTKGPLVDPSIIADLELCKFLSNKGIESGGIDFCKQVGQQYFQEEFTAVSLNKKTQGQAYDNFFLKWEPTRISNMKKNLFRMLRSLEKTGGVIVAIHHGRLHTERLAATMALSLKEYNKEHGNLFDFEVLAMDWIIDASAKERAQAKARQFMSADSEQLQSYYRDNPIKDWPLQNSNGIYSCPLLFNKLMGTNDLKVESEDAHITHSFPDHARNFFAALHENLGERFVQINAEQNKVSLSLQWFRMLRRINPVFHKEVSQKFSI